MQAPLNDDQLAELRCSGLIESSEIAYRMGDMLIAENVLTKQTRILGQTASIINESKKRLLKG